MSDIIYGLSAPDIPEQLKAQGINFDERKAEEAQKFHIQVLGLHIRGILTDSERNKALHRITKYIKENVIK